MGVAGQPRSAVNGCLYSESLMNDEHADIPEITDELGAPQDGDGGPLTLEDELTQRQVQYLRLAADFENFKRRKAQELADRARYGSEEAALALLPVLDNLRRAVEHAPAEAADTTLLDGLRMVVQQFEAAFQGLGITAVATVGTRFDPAVHQAIAGEESDEVDEDTVVAELQSGYQLHDRLLRPAMVRVAHPRHATTPAAD